MLSVLITNIYIIYDIYKNLIALSYIITNTKEDWLELKETLKYHVEHAVIWRQNHSNYGPFFIFFQMVFPK